MNKVWKVEQKHFESYMHDFDIPFVIVIASTWQRAKGIALSKHDWDKNNVDVVEIDLNVEQEIS